MSGPTVLDGSEGGELHGTVREADVTVTIREASPASTVREARSAAATVREETGSVSRATSGGGGSGLMRLPEGLSSRYGIERELPTRGNEADLFVVRPLADDDGAEVVVKLYRANVHPKDEVLTRIAALDGQHVIRQIGHGVSEGRSYEVIEYAAEGSLADLMREMRFDDVMLKAMIREVTAGLGYLHALDPPIVHRDVKPDNILVRSRDPLDLVLTDFGLSSVLEGGSWRASTLDRTIKYAAPEASAGQVSREMDWWSLGMMVAEAATGLHPFAGVAEQTIGIHYSNRRPVPLDGVADERVKLMCQGLLCYDRKQRWSSEEVGRWLAGDTSLRAPVEETRQAVSVPFKFAGGSYGTLPDLAAAMAGNWEAAQKTVARADGLLAWLKDEAKEYEAWQWLSEITQDKAQLDAGLKVTLLLPMLDPNLPVMLEGEAFTPERLLAEATAADAGTDNVRTARLKQLWEHLPALAELTPAAAWLKETHANIERCRKEISELISALGADAPTIADTNTWAFIWYVIAHSADPEASAAKLETVEGLLIQLPDDAASWVAPLKAADRSMSASTWLLVQIESHLRELTAEIKRRATEEAVRKIVAEKAAKIIGMQDDLREAGWALTPQTGHSTDINSIAFTPDGQHIVTGSGDSSAGLWDLNTGRQLRVFTGHAGEIQSLAITPDGRYLVTGSRDSTARLWHISTGRELRIFTGHSDLIYSVAVTPDGRHLVTGSQDKSAKLWDIATGRELRTFAGHPTYVSSVAVTPDGQHLAMGGGGTARLLDLRTGRELHTLSGDIHCIAITPDGRHLVTGGYKTTQLWDIATGRRLRAFDSGADSLAVTPDGRNLVTHLDRSIYLFDINTGQEQRSFSDGYYFKSVAVSPDGRRLIAGSFKYARLWDVSTGQSLRAYTGYNSLATSVAIVPNGQRLVISGRDKTARLLDLTNAQQVRIFTEKSQHTGFVGVTPNGRELVTAREFDDVRLWDLASGQVLRSFRAQEHSTRAVAITSDGRHLVIGGVANTARLWNLLTGQEERAFTGHTSVVTSVAVTLDGRHLVTASGDKTVRLWDFANGQELRVFAHAAWVNSVAVTPDGRHMVTGSRDKIARMWSVATGQEERIFIGHTGAIDHVSITPDGRHLITASADFTARTWDIATGRALLTFVGHAGGITNVAVTPDGLRIITVSADKTARLWELATGRMLWSLMLMGELGHLTFDSNGQLGHINGDLNSLLHFVRDMDVLSAVEILDGKDETWRQPAPAPEPIDFPATETFSPYGDKPSANVQGEPAKSELSPPTNVLGDKAPANGLRDKSEPRHTRVHRPSLVSTFVRKLLR